MIPNIFRLCPRWDIWAQSKRKRSKTFLPQVNLGFRRLQPNCLLWCLVSSWNDGYQYQYHWSAFAGKAMSLWCNGSTIFPRRCINPHLKDCSLSTGTSKFHLVRPISRDDGEILSSGWKSFQEVLNLLPATAWHKHITSTCSFVFASASPLTPEARPRFELLKEFLIGDELLLSCMLFIWSSSSGCSCCTARLRRGVHVEGSVESSLGKTMFWYHALSLYSVDRHIHSSQRGTQHRLKLSTHITIKTGPHSGVFLPNQRWWHQPSSELKEKQNKTGWCLCGDVAAGLGTKVWLDWVWEAICIDLSEIQLANFQIHQPMIHCFVSLAGNSLQISRNPKKDVLTQTNRWAHV